MVTVTTREVRAEVEIDAPAGEVWEALTDWDRQGQWMLGTRVGVVSGDGRSVGSRLWGFTGVFDVGFLDQLEITEWTPPERCVACHRGRLLRGSAEFAVSPRGGGVALSWTERLEFPAWLAGPALALGMRASLRRLAAQISVRPPNQG
jgi:uncharacterized protein YndB with AHSA1/START domain